jgi:hypothetical protein
MILDLGRLEETGEVKVRQAHLAWRHTHSALGGVDQVTQNGVQDGRSKSQSRYLRYQFEFEFEGYFFCETF